MLESVVHYLLENNITIATMESCTGGLLTSLITDVSGASNIIKFSAVTYSTEYKIKMGVASEVIAKYTVYSEEVAREMARVISEYANSDLGIGITGKLASNIDETKEVYLCLYDRRCDKYYTSYIIPHQKKRSENKLEVIASFVSLFNSTIKK